MASVSSVFFSGFLIVSRLFSVQASLLERGCPEGEWTATGRCLTAGEFNVLGGEFTSTINLFHEGSDFYSVSVLTVDDTSETLFKHVCYDEPRGTVSILSCVADTGSADTPGYSAFRFSGCDAVDRTWRGTLSGAGEVCGFS